MSRSDPGLPKKAEAAFFGHFLTENSFPVKPLNVGPANLEKNELFVPETWSSLDVLASVVLSVPLTLFLAEKRSSLTNYLSVSARQK